MRTFLIAAASTFVLIAGCSQPAEESSNSGSNSAAVVPKEDPVTALPASPPPTKEAALKLMHERHENMEDIRDALRAASREIKAETPDLPVIQASAATIHGFAPKIPSWFPPGTGPDVGKTMAKPEIWQKPEDFAVKARDFRIAAAAFDSAAKSGDIDAIKASTGELGKTCKSCHDSYRNEHKH